jgi:hypothetical protein
MGLPTQGYSVTKRGSVSRKLLLGADRERTDDLEKAGILPRRGFSRLLTHCLIFATPKKRQQPTLLLYGMMSSPNGQRISGPTNAW